MCHTCYVSCCTDAELVLCSSRDGVSLNWLKYISSHTLLQDGSNDTTFDPPSLPLVSTFNVPIFVSGDCIGPFQNPIFVSGDCIGPFQGPIFVSDDCISPFWGPIFVSDDCIGPFQGAFIASSREKILGWKNSIALFQLFLSRLCIGVALIDTFSSIAAHHWPGLHKLRPSSS